MNLLGIFAKVHSALDFWKGNKTKVGVAVALVGKAVGAFDPHLGQAIEHVGDAIAGAGLAFAVTRPIAESVN